MSLFGWIFRSRRRRPVSWRLRSSNNKENHQHHTQQNKNSDHKVIVDDNHTSTTKPIDGIDNCCSTKTNKNSKHVDSNNNGNIIDPKDEDLLFQCIQTALLTTPPSSCRRRRESRQSRPNSTIIKNSTSTLNPVPTKRWSTGMLLVDFEEMDHFYYRTEKQKQLSQTSPIRPLHSPSLLSTTTAEATIITSNPIDNNHYVEQFNNNNIRTTAAIGQVTSPQLSVIQRSSSVARRRRSSRVQSIPPTCGYHFLNSIPEIVENNNTLTAASQKSLSSTPSPPLNLI